MASAIRAPYGTGSDITRLSTFGMSHPDFSSQPHHHTLATYLPSTFMTILSRTAFYRPL